MARFDFDEVFGEDYLHFYLPLLTDARNAREAEEIVAALGLEPAERVLDAPCGHGRISGLLAARGMAVTGVDAAPLFLEKARTDAAADGVAVDYRLGDLRDLPVGRDESYDAVVNWFTSFGYFDDADNRRVLREFHRVLRPGGRLLIETIHRDAFVRGFTPAPFAHVTAAGPDGTDLLIDASRFDPEEGRVHTDRTTVRAGRVSSAAFSIRLPTVTELRAWLEDAGFSSVRFGSRQGQPLGLDTHRLVVVAVA